MAESGHTINIFGKYKVRFFEYFYMVVMVMYMAQMTSATGRMIGTVSGNLFPFLLPILLTAILLVRNKIQWKSTGLIFVLSIFGIWSILSLVKYNEFASTTALSYHFFLYYAILIAFIHTRVYRRSYFLIFEHIIVWICKLSIVFWLLNIAFFNTLDLNFLPPTSHGNNIFYLYNWISPSKVVRDSFALILRNPGCSWEPGRFAVIVCLAIYCNLLRNGIKFRHNSEILWLLLALISTQSTTGFLICLVLYTIFFVKKFDFTHILGLFTIMIPLWFAVSRLDFMEAKITEQIDVEGKLNEYYDSFEHMQSIYADDEYTFSLGRFESLYFDFQNALSDPLLGYSRDQHHSNFYSFMSSNVSLTGGLTKIFAQYGFPMGVIIFLLLAISSSFIGQRLARKNSVALFIIVLMASFSYIIWCVPVFTTFWLYGIFANENEIFNKTIVRDYLKKQ